MSTKGVLQTMITEAEFDEMNIESSVDQMADQISLLQEKIDALRNAYMTPISIELKNYLENVKMPQYGGISVTYGVNYNVINIIDWTIDGTSGVVYQYNGVGWDNDPVINDDIARWDFGYDYIYRQPGTTGTYGLQPQIDQMNLAISIATYNKTKYRTSKVLLKPYV